MATIAALNALLSADSAAFTRDMSRAEAAVRSNSARMNRAMAGLQRGFDQTRARVARFAGGMFSLRGVVATLAGSAGIGLLARQSLDFADSIGKTADKVGFTTDQLQELRFAAEQNGVAQTSLDMALQRFSRRVGEVSQGQGDLLKTARQYNIEVRNSDGTMRSNIDLFRAFADVIRNAESDQEALRIAFKLFDSEGAALVNLMRRGADGVDAFRAQARAAGLVLDESLIRKAEASKDRLNVLEKALRANATVIGAELAPMLIKATEGFANLTRAAREAYDFFKPEATKLRELTELEGDIARLQVEQAQRRAAIEQALNRGRANLTQQQLADLENIERGFLRAGEQLNMLLERRRRLLREIPVSAGADTGGRPRPDDEGGGGGDVGGRRWPAWLGRVERPARPPQDAPERAIIQQLRAEHEMLAEVNRRASAEEDKRRADALAFLEERQTAFLQATNQEIALIERRRDAHLAALQAMALSEAESAEARKAIITTAEIEIGEVQQRRIADWRASQERELEAVRSAVDQLGYTFTSAFENAIVSGNNLRDVAHGLFQDLTRLAVRAATMNLFGAVSSGLTGLVGGLLGGGGGLSAGAQTFLGGGPFQHGGSFKVGGRGGTDRNYVGFRASRGERVDVLTPEQQRGQGATAVSIVNHIDARGAERGVELRIEQAVKEATRRTLAAIEASARAGGRFASLPRR